MRRILTHAAMCILIGALLNVLVAWSLHVLVARGVVSSSYEDLPAVEAGFDGWSNPIEADYPVPKNIFRARVLGWDRSHVLAIHAIPKHFPISADMVSYSINRVGLPARSFQSEHLLRDFIFPYSNQLIYLPGTEIELDNWRNGFEIPSKEITIAGMTISPMVFPRRLILAGFAFNTVFYAALLAAPLFGVPAWRRHRRRIKGKCIGCGYDLASLAVCPECGYAKGIASGDVKVL